MNGLTKRQSEVLDFINAYAVENGRAPTVREIARRFEWSSTNAAAGALEALSKKGAIQLGAKGSARRVLVKHPCPHCGGLV
jgi:SOS-response transcriptional repressor LexA